MAKVSRELLKEAKENGWNTKQIAEQAGVSKQAVCAMVKKYAKEDANTESQMEQTEKETEPTL